MKYIPWLVAILAGTVAAVLYFREPKTLEVVKAAERKFTPEELRRLKDFEDQNKAQFTSSDELLKGIKRLGLVVIVPFDEKKPYKNQWNENEIKEKLTLELRKIGLEVDSGPYTTAIIELNVDFFSYEGNVTCFTASISISTVVTALAWDFKFHQFTAKVWEKREFGYFSLDKANEMQSTVITHLSDKLIGDLLKANPIKRE